MSHDFFNSAAACVRFGDVTESMRPKILTYFEYFSVVLTDGFKVSVVIEIPHM